MCTEHLTRYRHCTHTRLLHWTYCPILTPSSRHPSTGRSCRKYKLRYKESPDTTSCFECKVFEIVSWTAVRSPTFSEFQGRSPTFSAFPERSPTVSSFGVRRSPTFSTFGSSAGLLGMGDVDGEMSVVASEEPVSLGVSEDSKESRGQEERVDDGKGRGVKSWFKKTFKAREGYDDGVFGFQRMDA